MENLNIPVVLSLLILCAVLFIALCAAKYQISNLQDRAANLEWRKDEMTKRNIEYNARINELRQVVASKIVAADKAAENSPLKGVKLATWYDYSLEGLPGYSKTALTCASREHAKGTQLRITNQQNGKSVLCFVNDYGPAAGTGKHVDLSSAAFKKIADPSVGVIPVTITVELAAKVYPRD